MHNNYSESVTTLLDDSKKEARRHRSRSVRPEHLLMAILKRRGTVADKIIDELHVNKADLTIDCENKLLHDVEDDASQAVTSPELDENTNNIMILAALEARMAKENTVEIEHLLLAILHDTNNNPARAILEKNNMNYDNVTQCLFDKKDKDNTPVNKEADHSVILDGMELSEDEDENDEGNDDNKNDTKTEEKSKTKGGGKTPVIDAFAIDLTKVAGEGKMDPVVGREKEIIRLQEILCRRKKNNPVLIGEPGVGKSAIVEGLAQMIASGKTSSVLHNKRLVALDMASMVAGTKYRGQFEERIKNLIKELEANPDIIIFIDEIHTIIGAGSAAGTMDAANMLKPALARGAVQCIGATTLDEYRKSIEKDGALERRFQKIIVEPSTPEQTMHILSNIKDKYEEYHHVTYSDDALVSCVKLSERYITDRAFPDKAIDVMDEVGARIHLHHVEVPSSITELEDKISTTKQKKLDAVQNQNFELAANYRDMQTKYEEELVKLNNSWEKGDTGSRKSVSVDDVADVVANMTGIPVQRVAGNEGERLRNMSSKLKESVISQDKAIDKIVRAIQRNRVGIHDPNHPIGAFMFLGPTGVGKTYLAKKLAEEMFGSADDLIRIDMSEYSESFNTSRLVGAPPGYVGYEEGGQLTERVRRKPYSIVLLDEIEKANSSVFNMLLQVLDEGRLTDGNGRLIDFRNTVIIMTSNTGTRQLKEFAHGVGFNAANGTGGSMNEKDKEYARSIIQKSLSKQFAPEFLNRLDEIITFDQLDQDAIRKIVDIELKGLCKRIENIGYKLVITDEIKNKLAEKGYDVQYGARPLKRAIQTYVEDVVCERILSNTLSVGDEIIIDTLVEA
jgi:ATP-dependent Clp protease ATP-binding subunit ClpC